MEQAVNGSGGELHREPVVDTNNQWTCAECKTVNTIEDAPNYCGECGSVRVNDDGPDLTSDDETHEFIGEITEEQIKAGLSNLSGGIADSQDIENAARAEESLPPLERAGLLDFGPFNSDAALKAIFEKSAEVRELQADYERKKDLAKDAKGELDIASKALVNIIESLKNRRTQALNPSQPFLKDVSADAPSVSTSRCPWERQHPGQSCPICTRAAAEDLVPALESEVHPEHEGHATVAEAARVKNVLEPLADKLRGFKIFTESIELQQLSTEDLNALIAYVDEPTADAAASGDALRGTADERALITTTTGKRSRRSAPALERSVPSAIGSIVVGAGLDLTYQHISSVRTAQRGLRFTEASA